MDGEIVMMPNKRLFVPGFSNYEEEAMRREKMVDEELQKGFDDLHDADDDSDYEFDWNPVKKSVLLKMDNSHPMYIRRFNIYAEHSYAEAPKKWEEISKLREMLKQTLPQTKSSCLSSSDNHPAEHFQANDLEASDHLSEGVSDADSNHEPTRDDSSSPHHSSSSGNLPAEHSQANDPKASDHFSSEKDVSSIYNKDERLYASESPSASYQTESALKKNELDWEDQYRILHALFQGREVELIRVQNENTRLTNEIESLQLKDSHAKDWEDQYRILHVLLQSRRAELIRVQNENTRLKNEIKSLQLKDSHTFIVMKLQKEVLQLKEERDKLRESLGSKVETKSSGWTSVVLSWMWNRFTATVHQAVTNLFPNLKTDAS